MPSKDPLRYVEARRPWALGDSPLAPALAVPAIRDVTYKGRAPHFAVDPEWSMGKVTDLPLRRRVFPVSRCAALSARARGSVWLRAARFGATAVTLPRLISAILSQTGLTSEHYNTLTPVTAWAPRGPPV